MVYFPGLILTEFLKLYKPAIHVMVIWTSNSKFHCKYLLKNQDD